VGQVAHVNLTFEFFSFCHPERSEGSNVGQVALFNLTFEFFSFCHPERSEGS
jgi:hypothetical protein